MNTNPFLGCRSLSEITLGEGSELEMEDGMIYSGTTLILRTPAYADTDVVIREGTTELGHAAFYSSNAVSVVIPDSVTSVDRMIFKESVNLENVKLSANIKHISQYMFERCISLKEIVIPEGVEEIVGGSFMWCSSLESVSLPSTLTKIGDYSFCRCESLESITIPASVTQIGEKAFSNCSSLKDIYYGGSEQDWNAALGADVFNNSEDDGGELDVTVHFNHG